MVIAIIFSTFNLNKLKNLNLFKKLKALIFFMLVYNKLIIFFETAGKKQINIRKNKARI